MKEMHADGSLEELLIREEIVKLSFKKNDNNTLDDFDGNL